MSKILFFIGSCLLAPNNNLSERSFDDHENYITLPSGDYFSPSSEIQQNARYQRALNIIHFNNHLFEEGIFYYQLDLYLVREDGKIRFMTTEEKKCPGLKNFLKIGELILLII
ncbi:hypothetical protein [Alphaproteobacteria bacterium endosymbiont of Tiliacea citrago]|uniref:hypothetical protein n=1 Tax=Alphaproteobacteria bacterium endosymbiont of Tiliacea citrago TaxID=3077944 RepID=UPI00313CB25E